MQPPSDGSYPGNQGPQSPQDPRYQPQAGDEPSGGYGYPQGQNPGYQPQGGSYPGGYSYPQQGPPQQGPPQQGGYPTGPGYPVTGGYGYQPPPRGFAQRGWFWITVAAVVVIAAVVISTLLVTGGGSTPVGQGTGGPTTSSSSSQSSSSSDTSSSDTSSSDTSSSDTSSTSSSSSKAGGDIGRTFDVTGIQPGEKLALTLIAVDQNARSTDSYEKPDAGMHYVATELRVRNIGSPQYADAVNNCISVYDAANSKFETSFLESLSSGKTFDEIMLSSGQTAQGWSVFEMPIGKTITSVTYTPDSGIADSTVQWKLG